MKFSLKFNQTKSVFNIIILLVWIKLALSYLSVKLSYFQRHLIPNAVKNNLLGLPENISNTIEFLLLPLLIFFILLNYRFLGKIIDVFFLSIIMFGLNLVTSVFNQVSIFDSINFTLKIFTPIYLFLALIIYHNKYDLSIKIIVKRTVIICLILTIIGLLFFDPSINRLKKYLPIFFSGSHTHSYVLVSVCIAIGYFIYKSEKRMLLIGFLLLSFVFLYFGYNVRTALLMYLLYILTMLFLISDFFKLMFIKVLIFTPLILIFIALFISALDLNQFSSGRTDMYAEKIKQLSTFGIFDWLFGRGFGSDLIETKVWWWEKKGSHSDVISFLVENGIIYLGFYFLTIMRLIFLNKKVNILYAAILIGCFVSGVISNGIFVRPLAGYVIFIVLAYVYTQTKERPILSSSVNSVE